MADGAIATKENRDVGDGEVRIVLRDKELNKRVSVLLFVSSLSVWKGANIFGRCGGGFRK